MMDQQSRSSLLSSEGQTVEKNSPNWGYPGYLSQSEVAVYVSLSAFSLKIDLVEVIHVYM